MIRVNENLKKAASINPTNKTHRMTIFELCRDIETNEIILPLYQRDVSWTMEKNIELLNYQLLGKAPVSPISMNEIKDETLAIPQVEFISRELITDNLRRKLSVTDGQQRLTCNFKAYTNHEDFKDIVLDIKNGKFDLKKEYRDYYIPVGILLNKEEKVMFDYCKKNDFLSNDEVKDVILQIRNKIKSYTYTINQAEDLTEEQQIEWFEVLNNAGSRVTKIEMDIAKQRAKGIDAYKEYIQIFKEKILEYDGKLFRQKTTEVSYPMTLLNSAYEFLKKKEHANNYSPIASDYTFGILDDFKTKEEVLEVFSVTLKAVDRAIDFIKTNNLKKKKRIEYVTYLSGYFVFNNTKDIEESRKKRLINWYNESDFTDRGNTEKRDMFSELLHI